MAAAGARRPRIVTLTLNPAIDISSEAEQVRHTRKTRTFNEAVEPGGGGINVARVLHRLGCDVCALFLAGGTTGKALDNLLQRAGIKRRMAARFAIAEARGETLGPPPPETAMGALLGHITGGADAETFQPMNVNFGLMPPPPGRLRKADRKKAYTERARSRFAQWVRESASQALEPC